MMLFTLFFDLDSSEQDEVYTIQAIADDFMTNITGCTFVVLQIGCIDF
jgi:hypothetical protein